ncbi:MFS transporter [Chryseolinea sp. Jin1]|uniref:MFS transporter n=2 Tax=Chryseolinea lacunae TaxID=2801331 RepID=A0ABS1L024_9BACT|nr:MFS transporter [Chryseolinea lacunae]
MLMPKLPSFLSSLGGGGYKGFIIFLFTVTALISRPFSGKLADKLGRVPVMMAGCIVCFFCSLVYPFTTTVFWFFILRLVHGFSTGFTPTGQAAYLSDVIPAARRGEAIGLLGTMGTLGSTIGPAFGSLIAESYGLQAMFFCSSALALMSTLILLGIRETLFEKHPFSRGLIKVKRSDLFEPRVLVPCIVMLMSVYAYGAMYTLLPDFAEYLKFKNTGILLSYLAAASLFVRLVAGRASDRYGRKPVLCVATFIIAIALLVTGFAHTKLQLILGVVMYGFAYGAVSPTLLAWATDLSDEHHKGRGLASLYIFMEMGIGIGALMSGWVYGNDPSNFILTFSICSALAAASFVYLLFNRPVVKVSA